MIDIIQAAGWPIYPIIVCSIVALGIIGERFYTLRSSLVLPSELQNVIIQVKQGVKINKETLDNISNSSLMGFVLATGIFENENPKPDVEASMIEAASSVSKELEKFLTTLGTIATLSPLLGLLGTIVGMIEIFGASSATGLADPARLAHGISVALYNAAFGIIVAVPSLICYRHFRATSDSLMRDMEATANKLARALNSKEID